MFATVMLLLCVCLLHLYMESLQNKTKVSMLVGEVLVTYMGSSVGTFVDNKGWKRELLVNGNKYKSLGRIESFGIEGIVLKSESGSAVVVNFNDIIKYHTPMFWVEDCVNILQ